MGRVTANDRAQAYQGVILFTLLPLLFTFGPDGVRFVFWGRHPGLVASFWGVATASWFAAFVMHSPIRQSGL